MRGGAEIFADKLVDELREREHEVELVTVPFKWYPGTKVLSQAFLWRLLDLEESDGRPIDCVIATKFPSYCVRHPNKRVWVLHQFRQAYELDRTDLGQFGEEPADRALRRSVQTLDRIALGEAKRLFATSQNVAGRIERSTGLQAEVMPHPPQELPYRCDEYGDFVLSVGRLDRAKRNDLLLEAAALDPALRVVITGEGPDRERLERLARERGLNGRAEFTGRIDEVELACALRALPGGLLRAGRRGLRDGALRGVPVREAGADDDGRGRSTRDRHRRAHGARDGARAGRARGGGGLPERESGRGGELRPRRPRARCAGDLGRLHRALCSHEGRVLQPDAAGALGDRGLQRPAPARASAPRRRPGRAARADATGAWVRPRPLPPRQQPGRARLDRRCAAPPTRRRRAARLRPAPSRRRVDDRPARRARLPRRDGARGRRRRPPARARRAGQADPAALGEPRRRLPPGRRGARARDGADRALPPRRGARARSRLRGPDLADPAPRLARARPRSGGARGRSALRLLREHQREQAHPAGARGVRVGCAATTKALGCSSSGRPRRASTSTAGCSGWACRATASSGWTTCRRSDSGS